MDGRENLPELTRSAKLAEDSQLPVAPAAGSGNSVRRTRVPWLRSLSAKILGLTVVFIMVSEAVILLPSIAKFRNDYFNQKIETAGVAAGALLAMESQALGQADIDIVLDSVGAESLAVMRGYESRLLTMQEVPGDVAYHVDVEEAPVFASMWQAVDTLINGGDRLVRVSGKPTVTMDRIDLILNETALRDAMLIYARNILVISLILSVVTATLVFMSLRWLLVRPLRQIIGSMRAFSHDPENLANHIHPSGRRDEVGVAENHLADMQDRLLDTLNQQRRLAELGLAVSKINHDLRNMLASAQLFSDRFTELNDPTVQRFAPKLIATLDRAVAFCQSSLTYGKVQEAKPQRRLVNAWQLVDDVAGVLGLNGELASSDLEFLNNVPVDLEVDADPEQLHRVLSNLMRNAIQVLKADPSDTLVRRIEVTGERHGAVAYLAVKDTGPGVPERARQHLFKAFRGSVRVGGIGLGLAIANELVMAHGGTLKLEDTATGAHFSIELPDQTVSLSDARQQQDERRQLLQQ